MVAPPRRALWLFWLLFVALWIFVVLFPISTQKTRLAGAALFAFVLVGLLALCWQVRVARFAVIAFFCFLVALGFLPGRSVDISSLRDSNLHALRRYESTRYVWGGESFKGIDCSGLIRRGIVDGSFLQGVRTLNPRLIRTAVFLWWHDCTAKDLGEEYLGMTDRVGQASTINAVDYSTLQPGDLAVTTSGIHILAYLGNEMWIEADPELGKVVEVRVPSSNVWFGMPVNLVRWKVLNPASD